MSQCKIHLENYSGSYYPGSEIRGRLECYFDDETTVRGIKVRLKCKEHNQWMGSESYTDPSDNKVKTRSVTLTGDNSVMFIEQMLFGSESGSRTLNRGRHVYPFSFTLPHDIPSTFSGPYGNITYKLKAVVDRPFKIDYEDHFIFVVASPLDFNTMSKDLQEMVTYSDEKTVCCWCCKGGNITMDVELPKTAFVPGEIIHFRVITTNMSNENVENLKVKFTKTITYKVTSPHSESRDDTDEILSFTEHGVGAHGEHVYDLELALPGYLEVPNFTNCNLFKVEYKLDVTAVMPSCTLDLDITAWDIKMGHVMYAFRGNEEHQGTNKANIGFTNNVPPIDGAYPSQLPPVSGFPPYPPAAGDSYPPYPPAAGGSLPPYPPAAGGSYPPGGYPSAPSGYPSSPPSYVANSSDKAIYPSGPPTAPSSSIANAPIDDNPKAREAALSGPSAPPPSGEMPPPSYSQIQQSPNVPYPPQ